MSDELKNLGVARDAKGRFVNSGNLKGKPKGTKNYATRVAHAMMKEVIAERLQKQLDLAEHEDPVIAERANRFLLQKYTSSELEMSIADTMTTDNKADKLARIKELQKIVEVDDNEG